MLDPKKMKGIEADLRKRERLLQQARPYSINAIAERHGVHVNTVYLHAAKYEKEKETIDG